MAVQSFRNNEQVQAWAASKATGFTDSSSDGCISYSEVGSDLRRMTPALSASVYLVARNSTAGVVNPGPLIAGNPRTGARPIIP